MPLFSATEFCPRVFEKNFNLQSRSPQWDRTEITRLPPPLRHFPWTHSSVVYYFEFHGLFFIFSTKCTLPFTVLFKIKIGSVDSVNVRQQELCKCSNPFICPKLGYSFERFQDFCNAGNFHLSSLILRCEIGFEIVHMYL